MNLVRTIAISLLVILSVGAFVGSIPMIVHPQNNQWGLMPLSLLHFSPFHSYLIPGFLLLASNALLPIWVLWRVIGRKSLHGLWTVLQGCVLLGFLSTECWMLRVVAWPHFTYAAVALALMVCGLAMRRDSSTT